MLGLEPTDQAARVGDVVPQLPGRCRMAAPGCPVPGDPEVVRDDRVVEVDAEHVERASVRAVVQGLDRPPGHPGGGLPPPVAGDAASGGAVGRPGGGHGPEQTLGAARGRERGVVAVSSIGHPLVEVAGLDPGPAGQEKVGEHPVELVHAQATVVGGHHGIGTPPVDHLVPGHMGGHQMVDGHGGVAGGQRTAGREHPEQPRPDGQDVDLVDGDPVTDRRSQCVDHHLGPLPEPSGGVGSEPEVLAQPRRVGEVVERDQGREAAFEAPAHDVGVPGQGGSVGLPVFGEDPRPLDAQPEAVAPQAGRTVQRLLGVIPEPHGPPRGLDPTDLLPGQPVVGRFDRAVVPPLHLVPGRGHAEQEVMAESPATGRPVVPWFSVRGQRPASPPGARATRSDPGWRRLLGRSTPTGWRW